VKWGAASGAVVDVQSFTVDGIGELGKTSWLYHGRSCSVCVQAVAAVADGVPLRPMEVDRAEEVAVLALVSHSGLPIFQVQYL
jgi:hypothetical protein